MIYIPMDRLLVCLQILIIVSNAAVNTEYKYTLGDTDFISFVCLPPNEIAGSYDRFIFDFSRNLHTVFHSGLTNYITNNSVQEFLFLCILAIIRCLLSFC